MPEVGRIHPGENLSVWIALLVTGCGVGLSGAALAMGLSSGTEGLVLGVSQNVSVHERGDSRFELMAVDAREKESAANNSEREAANRSAKEAVAEKVAAEEKAAEIQAAQKRAAMEVAKKEAAEERAAEERPAKGTGQHKAIVLLGVSEEPAAPKFCSALHIDFANARAVPLKAGRTEITALGQWLLAHPKATVVARGHADGRGSVGLNLALSDRRARWVKARLVLLGVAETRITAQAFGEYAPLEGSAVLEGRNRRVELTVRATACPEFGK